MRRTRKKKQGQERPQKTKYSKSIRQVQKQLEPLQKVNAFARHVISLAPWTVQRIAESCLRRVPSNANLTEDWLPLLGAARILADIVRRTDLTTKEAVVVEINKRVEHLGGNFMKTFVTMTFGHGRPTYDAIFHAEAETQLAPQTDKHFDHSDMHLDVTKGYRQAFKQQMRFNQGKDLAKLEDYEH
jgi:hypothetical protein